MPATKKKLWRRETTQAEERVDFKQLEETWTGIEGTLIDNLVPVMNQVIERFEKEVRAILDSKNYKELNNIRMGYKDKIAMIFKVHMLEAFKLGKDGVYEEFNIQKDITVNASAREYIGVKADAVAVDILDKIRSSALFVILNGIKTGLTTDQIIKDVKGPVFKQQQAEELNI